jgi:hypothetical protein
MTVLKGVNLAAAFLLELCLLAALGYWGFHVGRGPVAKIGLGLGAPLLMAIVWGIFMAPRGPRHLSGLPYRALALVLYGLGVAALFAAGQPTLALILAVAVAINQILAAIWRQ